MTRFAALRRDVRLELAKEHFPGLVCAQAGDALKLALAFRDELLAPGDGGRGRLLEIARGLFTAAKISLHPVGCGQPIRERASLVGERLFEVDDFLLPDARRGFRR